MYEINKEIHTYMRCIKSLWNDYYRPLPDGEHDFADIKKLIWNTLVIKLLHETIEDISDGQIVVRARAPKLKLMVAVPTEAAIQWIESDRIVNNSLFRFEEFFDFRNWEDPREMGYVECWSLEVPEVHLLIRTEDVAFFYRERPQPKQ